MEILDDNDVRCYDAWLSSTNRDEEQLLNGWDENHVVQENDFHLDGAGFDYVNNNLTLGGEDFTTPKFSPESSDSGNYSPTSSLADNFNLVEPWNSAAQGPHEYTSPPHFVQQPSPPTVHFESPPPIVVTTAPIANYPTFVNTQEKKRVSPERFYATPVATTCTPLVFARPLETVALVPTTAQTFVLASTSSIKMEPILTPVKALPTLSIAPASVKSSPNATITPEDDYSKKLEDRRLRNRAAAQASRHRKRMQMDEMKDKMREIEEERDQLRLENEVLRKRIAELEADREQMSPPRAKKPRAVAGACLAMCALVFTFYSSYPNSYTSPSTDLQFAQDGIVQSGPEFAFLKRHGRSLAAVSNYEAPPDYPLKASGTAGGCGGPLNMTQKIRLNDDISSWLHRHEQRNLVELRKGLSPYLIYNSPGAANFSLSGLQKEDALSNSTELIQVTAEDRRNRRISRRNALAARRQSREAKKEAEGAKRKAKKTQLETSNTTSLANSSDYQLSVRSQFETHLVEQLAAAMQQREDVLYVVTMKDYYLLPMLHRNITEPLKLSIVFPALSSSSNTSNKVKMMRFDCQIVGTELFDLPADLASVFNQSQQQN